jgi:hypothetical protein
MFCPIIKTNFGRPDVINSSPSGIITQISDHSWKTQGSQNSYARGIESSMLDASNVATKQSAPPGMGSGAAEGFGGETVFSGTNIQVTGVDEGDIVKTDGEYMYIVKDQTVVIVKAEPASEMSVVATINLEATPQEIYIKDNILIAFGYAQGNFEKMAADSMIMPYSSGSFLAFYNISDRTKPELLRRLEFEGNYTSSRLIDNRLYFITANYNFYPAENNILPRVFEEAQFQAFEARKNNISLFVKSEVFRLLYLYKALKTQIDLAQKRLDRLSLVDKYLSVIVLNSPTKKAQWHITKAKIRLVKRDMIRFQNQLYQTWNEANIYLNLDKEPDHISLEWLTGSNYRGKEFFVI